MRVKRAMAREKSTGTLNRALTGRYMRVSKVTMTVTSPTVRLVLPCLRIRMPPIR